MGEVFVGGEGDISDGVDFRMIPRCLNLMD